MAIFRHAIEGEAPRVRKTGFVCAAPEHATEHPRCKCADDGGRQGIDAARWRRRGGCPASEIGREACRERVCQYVSMSVVDGSLKKKPYNRDTNNASTSIIIQSKYSIRHTWIWIS